MVDLIDVVVHKNLCAIYKVKSSIQWRGENWSKAIGSAHDAPQALHELLEEMLLLIVIAIADARASGMAPEARSQKQKAQPRRGQRSVLDPKNSS